MVRAIGTYTITALYDGDDGQNAVNLLLSNENHTLTADSSGTPTSYSGASTTATVYDGTTDVTSQYTISKTDSTGVTSTILGNTITVTAITNGVGGTITITATKSSRTLTKVFTISVSKTGADGAGAKQVSINSSTQVFKSTSGASGTFTPQYIYLYTTFQNCTYSKWQYSTNGTTWMDVTSGQHSLTISTYDSVPNSLRIERNCDLYTSSVSSLSFKCISSDATIFDTISIIKLYDVTNEIYRSATEPLVPYEGMLWFDTTNGLLSLYTNGGWVAQDLSGYALVTDVNDVKVNRNKTWITQPIPPYNTGDLWIVQDTTDPNYGKILTCVSSQPETGTFSLADWIVPLTSYTTVQQMTQVIGKDPSSWDVTQGSLTSLINDNTNEIAGVSRETSKLAVRASGIEMSFSRTGTMNFLGNSSGQNNLSGWTISNADKPYISVLSALDASDVRSSIVSGNVFAFNMNKSSLTMTSNLFIPPTSNTFVVSAKVRIPGRFTFVTFTLTMYSDTTGTTSIGSKVLKVPYSEDAENEFILYHMVINKSDYADDVESAKLTILVTQEVDAIEEDPASHVARIDDAGNVYFYNNVYTYLKPIYRNIIITEFTSLSDITPVGDHAYHCIKDVLDNNGNIVCVRGTYYTNRQDASSSTLYPVTDSYYITMLDSNALSYYTLCGDIENIEETASEPVPTPSSVYIGDIMVNGGNQVMTWTPRQDENMWGENIKFNSDGIKITNKQAGYGRTLDSNSDIAFKLNEDGTIVSYIWKLTQTGFITKDIKCYGKFSMGYVQSESSVDLENGFTKIMEMSSPVDRSGIDEYLYL